MSVRPTILIIDDNPDERTIYGDILRHYGYDVAEATDALTGIRAARERLPGLILMDVMLPRISGLTATEVLRAGEQTCAIPIVAMSAYNPEVDEVRVVGCDAFVPKPLSPALLRQVAERYAGPPPEAPGAPMVEPR